MNVQPLETDDMIVVTVGVPTRRASDLDVTVSGNVVGILGPGGFRHEVPMLPSADLSRLRAYLFHDILELRAPRGENEGNPRFARITVQPIS
jgi:HSP20 family molecular chaperone IbpA